MTRQARIPRSWTEADPRLVAREQAAMAEVAPAMVWHDDLVWRGGRQTVGWVGACPAWAADRPEPAGVEELLDGRRLQLVICYPEAFPAVPPSLTPTEPDVPIERRTLHTWHVNGDGSLCLMQAADQWDPSDTAAELVRKAAGWFIEYLLVDAGRRAAMTLSGLAVDESVDELLAGSVA